jgi:hypothetical protein
VGHLVVVSFISIDGVIQAPLSPDEDRDGGFSHGGWVPPLSDDVVNGFMQEATIGAARMLLGRRTRTDACPRRGRPGRTPRSLPDGALATVGQHLQLLDELV